MYTVRIRRETIFKFAAAAEISTITCIGSWALTADHVPRFAEVGQLIEAVSFSLFFCGLVWVCYIALEPHVRRLWPDLIVSWTRLLSGRFRDPLVGRAILVGGVLNTGVILWVALSQLAHGWLGSPLSAPRWNGLHLLASVRLSVGAYLEILLGSVLFPVGLLFVLLLLRVLLRRQLRGRRFMLRL